MARCKLIIPTLLAVLPTGAFASDPALQANLAGMGGVAAAASEDNAAIVESPGLLGLHERYDLNAHFEYGPTGAARWVAAAVDSRTSRTITLGLLYRGDRANPAFTAKELPGWTVVGEQPSNFKRHHDITAALGFHGFDRRFGVGINSTFSIYNYEQTGSGSTANLGIGAGGRPTEWLDLGVAGQNLVPVKDIGVLPMSVIGGFRLHGSPGALLADLAWTDETPGSPFTVSSGGELPAGEAARLRAGYRYEGPIDRHAVTFGASAIGPGGGVDIAASVPVGPGQPTLSGLSVVIGLRIAAPTIETPPSW